MFREMWNNFSKLPIWLRILIFFGIFLVLIIASLDSSTDTEVSPKPSPTATPSKSPTVITASPTSSPTESASPTPESPVFFRTSALGNLDDMRRDVADAKVALNDGGLWKLYGNLFELQFNLGQLEALTPQEDYEERWYNSLLKLQNAMDTFSEGLDGNSVSASRKHLDGILSAISIVERTARTIGQ